MALYEVYSELEDLATYLGVDVEELPECSQRLIRRASELIKQATLNNVISVNESHLEALNLATCAQVEYWLSAGEDSAIIGAAKSYSLGDLSVAMDEKAVGRQLCSRAKNYLNQQGLLYRGVNIVRGGI